MHGALSWTTIHIPDGRPDIDRDRSHRAPAASGPPDSRAPLGRPLKAVAPARPSDASMSQTDAAHRRSAAVLALLAAGAAAFWFLPLGIDSRAHHALAISVFMIAAWMIQVLDHGVTGIVGCFLFW